jgi:hypothetical protein
VIEIVHPAQIVKLRQTFAMSSSQSLDFAPGSAVSTPLHIYT